jgi:hypothetical protein
MDKLDHYRQAIKNVLQYHADLMNGQPVPGEIVSLVYDEKTDHYLLIRHGYPRGKRVYYLKGHLRIHEGKIWVEYDNTHYSLVEDLHDEGVPYEDIIVSFHPVPFAASETAAA